MRLEFFVKNKRITRRGTEPLVGGTKGHYTISISFDREWDGLVKVLVLRNGDRTAELQYLGETPLPAAVSGPGTLELACHGYRFYGDKAAVIRTIRMLRPLQLRESGPRAREITDEESPTLLEQVLGASLEARESAAEAQAISRDLQQRADRGDFNGAPGRAPVRGVDYWTREEQQSLVHEAASRVDAEFDRKVFVDGHAPNRNLVTDAQGRIVTEEKGAGPGTRGGWYTPEAAQPEPGILELTFTPSLEEMGPVAPVRLTLPRGPAGQAPVKGQDYWTPEDQQLLVQQTLAAMPQWKGGVF